MTERTPLQELMASARQLAAEVAADPSRQLARLVGRDEVLDEVTRAIDELVEVVLVQQELLETLMRRVTELESR
ncbi:MAG TPA: hypothetical protein VLI04_06010 [Nocardioidaceae bacterium]|nr:hypothetical protein [Nocardioidaceae bacterium]